MATFDFKKEEKQFYSPKTTPSIIDIPEMSFILIDGEGNPNTSEEYKKAVETLYGLSYAIRMNKSQTGYFEYVVPPLEGFWSFADAVEFSVDSVILNKDKFIWTMLIRQPEFATAEVFEYAKTMLSKKKPHLDVSLARFEKLREGLCVQVMHWGPYDNEPATVKKIEKLIEEVDYEYDFSGTRRHHEIYLSDPRKVAPEKMKTVLRHPVKKILKA